MRKKKGFSEAKVHLFPFLGDEKSFFYGFSLAWPSFFAAPLHHLGAKKAKEEFHVAQKKKIPHKLFINIGGILFFPVDNAQGLTLRDFFSVMLCFEIERLFSL